MFKIRSMKDHFFGFINVNNQPIRVSPVKQIEKLPVNANISVFWNQKVSIIRILAQHIIYYQTKFLRYPA